MSDLEPTAPDDQGVPDDRVPPHDPLAPEEPLEPNEVQFRVMTAESVVFDLGDSSPLVHLMEAEVPFRSISIPIALPEAHALYNAMNAIEGRRPGTHELMASVIAELQADVIAVRIVRYEQGVFYAELDLMTTRGRAQFDCRTSDALILALRQGVPAPVLCADSVLSSFYS